MRIRKLRLKNIGVFDDEEIEFQPGPKSDKAEIHILTGENGTGKSTILMALAGVFDLYQEIWNPQINIAPLFDLYQEGNRKHPSNLLYKRFRYFEDDFGNYKSLITVSFEEDWQRTDIVGYPQVNDVRINRRFKELDEYKEFQTLANKSTVPLDFAVFAYSGYRHIESNEIISIGSSEKTNPLLGSLDFIKTRNQSNGLTINNWIADSISKSAVEKGRDPKKSEKFASAVKSLENAIAEITGWKVEFDLRTDPFDLRLKVNNEDLDFDVLPDGLRSLISWIGDLLMRVDLLKWNDDLSAFEKNLILLLDEIEVHLHPAWQRKVLPVVQKLFKNSQIFLSTHSPFVVNSVDGAWVYKLKLENGKAHTEKPILSEDGYSYSYVLEEIFGVKEDFGVGVQKQLDEFSKLRDRILENGNGSVEEDKKHLKELAQQLASQSDELNTIVQFELRQLSKLIKEEISI